ncbi:hypothetical protein LCGC14_2989610, partial [marine sediment metagenome]
LTTSYGSTVYIETGDESDRYYYVHLGYLTGLSKDTTYHYRFVATDERSNTIYSSDKTLTSATPSGTVVYIPGSMGSPQYTLDSANTTYIVTEDIDADYTAFKIAADNVTLDLGGHTITYNKTDYQVSGTGYDYATSSAVGVRISGTQTGAKIVNGKIIQGEGYNSASSGSYGYSPIWSVNSTSSGEVAGISADYIGEQITGMSLTYDFDAHHNVIKDRGMGMINRHQGCDAITKAKSAYNNLVKRVRHRGLFKTGPIYHNEVWGDSWWTNAHLIQATSNTNVYSNHVFGGGYTVVGIVTNGSDYSRTYNTSKYLKNVDVYDNFVYLYSVRVYDDRSAEYGPHSSGFMGRCMWGADNIEWYDNILVG